MRPTLAVYIFGHDLDKIAYPYLESIHSALLLTNLINSLADESDLCPARVYYCDCDSTDETVDHITGRFAADIDCGELVILEHPWGEHHTIQAHICNFILDAIGESVTFALKLDADEVLHERSYPVFAAELVHMQQNFISLGRPRYTHFTPDFDTTFPFIYDSKAVLARTGARLRFDTGRGGDACALGGAAEFQTSLEIYHYGKVATGREREALYKEWTFQQMYTELGFPDPKVEAQREQGYLDYAQVFDVSKGKGEFTPFKGSHPKVVQSWINKLRWRSRQFWEAQGTQP